MEYWERESNCTNTCLCFPSLQPFYVQFHAVLRSKTTRISYNEIVRYLPDLERGVIQIESVSFANLDVILDEVSGLPWWPVLSIFIS